MAAGNDLVRPAVHVFKLAELQTCLCELSEDVEGQFFSSPFAGLAAPGVTKLGAVNGGFDFGVCGFVFVAGTLQVVITECFVTFGNTIDSYLQ